MQENIPSHWCSLRNKINENIWSAAMFYIKGAQRSYRIDGSKFGFYICQNVYVTNIIQIGSVFPISLWNAVINGGHLEKNDGHLEFVCGLRILSKEPSLKSVCAKFSVYFIKTNVCYSYLFSWKGGGGFLRRTRDIFSISIPIEGTIVRAVLVFYHSRKRFVRHCRTLISGYA